jgi:rhodanese-related sulfurtransferase
LYGAIGTAAAPVVIDVRRNASFAADNRMIVGAIRRDPEAVQSWRQELPAGRAVAVYCEHGLEASQEAASALRSAGIDVRYVEHGITGWAEHRLPMRGKRDTEPRSWVTSERPKIDRIACPWLSRPNGSLPWPQKPAHGL